jgi:hypothetical protein
MFQANEAAAASGKAAFIVSNGMAVVIGNGDQILIALGRRFHDRGFLQ